MTPEHPDLIGQPVALRVRAGALRLPLRGQLVSETEQTLYLTIEGTWQLGVDKASVETIARDSGGNR